MKMFLSTALLAAFAASLAHAEVKVESRVFHSNLRLDAKSSTFYSPDSVESNGRQESFFNTAGVGVAGVFSPNQAIDMGIGYSYARYYVNSGTQIDQQVASLFSRFNLLQSETGKVYALVGASSHQLDQKFATERGSTSSVEAESSYSPIVNYDAGLGAAITLAGLDLGLEYKYSNTLSKGQGTVKEKSSYISLTGPVVENYKSKIKGISAETQELSMTLSVKI